MKLWQKISLLTAAILLISMVVYGGITVYETSNYNIRQTSSAASRQVRATAYALGQSLENAATEEMSDTARKAYLQFLLRRYSSRDYMLLQDWQLAANTTNFELTGNRLEQFDSYEPVAAFQQKNGRHLMIVGQKIPLSDSKNTSYQLLLVRDISEIYNNVLTQIGMFLIILGAIVAVAINAVFWMIRRMLKPLRDLRETAGAISQGQLDRRVRVRSNDEVGALSVSFNQMAAQIECQMEELAQVSERRKQLLGSLAHELKTPLSVLSATAELLGDNLAPEKQAHYLGVIQQQAHRMDGSVRQMLELSRLETGAKALRRTAFSLAELAQERLQAALPTDSTIHTEFAAQGEYEVNADRALLTRALDALLENAVQHTPEGGCITVHLADGVLSVTNTGDAIPADALPRLWEAYYQADPSRSAKGDGLGLSIAKTVFDLHGFTCGAENTEIGPKFWFRFADK